MFFSVNPYTGERIAQYEALSDRDIQDTLELSVEAGKIWRKETVSARAALLRNTAEILREDKERFALRITQEMGKPITESRAEIDKCAWVCEYYAENAAIYLEDEFAKTDAQRSYIRKQPLGLILAIMPWNFPFWQVFRFAAPTLTAGNTALLKHAANVMGCAEMIEEIFMKAGYPAGVFQNLYINHEQVNDLLSNPVVKAVSLTGSERAGVAIATQAGKYVKKCLLELGGNNAFIVLKDADIDLTVQMAVKARMLNNGQSCIAAKRFIVVDAIHDEFVYAFSEALKELKYGNPEDESTDYGPMARADLAEALQNQMLASIAQGAKLVLGGEQEAAMHEISLLTEVKPGMPAFDEETFGPLVAVIRAKDEQEAIKLAQETKYGLGLSIFSRDVNAAEGLVDQFEDGAVFINALVKSDPRLPFGGTKLSGYGRELAKEGILEFVNLQTVYIN
ncbi:NAD-dependent succinate-semialdehyde dehydrogenase [Chitinophagales bacterium]|nr:NAD-dependent succinate-semialdehyde dehydrogenase [Chitinophagales bacterium]